MISSIRGRSVWCVAICLLLASGAQAQQDPGTPRPTAPVRRFSVQPELWVRGAPRLGVTLMDMTRLLAHHYNAGSGVIVSAVVDGSPAHLAGLQVGDVIMAVNDQGIGSQTDLSYVLRGATGSITLAIVRYKRPLAVTVSPVGPMTALTGWVL
jgi:predicted metalloprotease with PDZ domain